MRPAARRAVEVAEQAALWAEGGRELGLLVHAAGMAAYRWFGKGRHSAGLNLGDCCAYALAQASGEPLLFKGDDFSRTDVKSVSLAD